MPLKEFIEKICPEGDYHHQIPPTTVALVDINEPPLHRYLADQLEAAFTRRGDTVLRVTADPNQPFPEEAKIAVQFFDLESGQETRPRDSLGRFPRSRERNHKKVIAAGTLEEIPAGADLTALTRQHEGRRAAQFSLIFEGRRNQSELYPDAQVLVGSMEGNVGLLHNDRFNPMGVFSKAAERLAFLSQAEMVNERVGNPPKKAMPFEDWISNPDVKKMQESSHILSQAKPRPLIWDLDIGKLGLSRRQELAIYLTLKTAGLGEGMQWTLIESFGEPILAVTETGVSKTDADPSKGNVVPVYGATEFGAVHYILSRFPKDHSGTIFNNPLLSQIKDDTPSEISSDLRGKRDHRPSIEAHESVLFAMVSAMLESDKFKSFKEILEYIDRGFQEKKVLPVIPKDMKPGAKSGIHTHNTASFEQKNPNIRVIEADMEGFGYPHSPPCGSREATILLLSAFFDSYKIYGKLTDDEVRIINLPGHGSVAFSKKDIAGLARDMAAKVKWEEKVRRY